MDDYGRPLGDPSPGDDDGPRYDVNASVEINTDVSRYNVGLISEWHELPTDQGALVALAVVLLVLPRAVERGLAVCVLAVMHASCPHLASGKRAREARGAVGCCGLAFASHLCASLPCPGVVSQRWRDGSCLLPAFWPSLKQG